jgi:hypothetical protein
MHVRMADQGLPPGVEDAEHADLRAEMLRIGGDLAERGGARLKEPGVHARTIATADVRLFSTAVLACSRSGSAKTRFGGFFLRDLDFGSGDGLLHRRRQLQGLSLLRRLSRRVVQAQFLRWGHDSAPLDAARDSAQTRRSVILLR